MSAPLTEDDEYEFQWLGCQIKLHHTLDQIAPTWDQLTVSNIFLSSAYLRALHAAPPLNMQFSYFTVWKAETLVGIVYTQLDKFQAKKSISYHRDDIEVKESPGLWTKFRNAVAARVEFTTLLCGNTLVTGSHGFLFNEEIGVDDQWNIVDHILHRLIKLLKKTGVKVRLLFVKDFFEPVEKLHMNPRTRVYHGFHAQPNMIMSLPREWKTYEDYCRALSSKYRVRVRRAYKKCEGVIKRELQIEDIEIHKEKLSEYYHDIADNASFNLFSLNPDYFTSVKKHLGDKYKVFGYFDRDRLIAFYSLMVNGDEIEAHFLGYEEKVNKEKQLYMNMLLDMISLSIDIGVHRIIYGRTAMEIKSSVGAEPYYMQFYLQYQNAIINLLVPRIYHMLEPEVEWVQRRPFKQ
jgi:predicted N-acyltransferase